jgi:hypothetical protein
MSPNSWVCIGTELTHESDLLNNMKRKKVVEIIQFFTSTASFGKKRFFALLHAQIELLVCKELD